MIVTKIKDPQTQVALTFLFPALHQGDEIGGEMRGS